MTLASIVTNTSFDELGAIFREHATFVVLSHLRPDGDAIGSQLGLALSLAAMGKSVRVLNEDGVPDSLAFLPGTALVERPQEGKTIEAEVAVACDTADRKRLGERVLAAMPEAALWVNLDHHVSNEGYGDRHYIDSAAPATGQIVSELLQSQGMPVTPEICACLYIAISTDTGSFQYPATTARTYRIAADLIDGGADPGALSQAMYENYPLRRVKLLGELLQRLEIGHGGQRASWSLPLDLTERLGVQPDDTDGLIDQIRSIRGVVVAAFFQETPDGFVRASLRSKDPRVDVCRICQRFRGGGHRLAAGVRLRASLEDAQTLILDAIDEALDHE